MKKAVTYISQKLDIVNLCSYARDAEDVVNHLNCNDPDTEKHEFCW